MLPMTHDLNPWITANWQQVPKHVHALTTTRQGGHSQIPFDTLNFGWQTGDAWSDVERNHALLTSSLQLPAPPRWLQQQHGHTVLNEPLFDDPVADGAYTQKPGVVLAIRTADCLPVVITNQAGTELAILHAGWRGLAAQIIDAGVARFHTPVEQLVVWLGPAIGACCYQVGSEIRASFLQMSQDYTPYFLAGHDATWRMDLVGIAAHQLMQHHIQAIYPCHRCTYHEPQWFYSYRRNGRTGRMATLAWLSD